MLDQVKVIKLEELNQQINKYQDRKKEIETPLNELQAQLRNFEEVQNNGLIKTKFTILERLFTRRHEYKAQKKQIKRIKKLPYEIEKTKKQIESESGSVQQQLENENINNSLEKFTEQINSIKRAKTLYELGISPVDAIKLIEENGKTPILNESDKVAYQHERDYTSTSQLIAVHKQGHMPTANMLKPPKDAKVQITEEITLNGKKYQYKYVFERNTVHFTLNGEVFSHMYGNWDNLKYAVLIPFDDIPKEKMASGNSVDTFTRGSVELTRNTWILCPKDEVKKLKTFNPSVNILGYEGENVMGFSGPFLTQLGYREESIGMYNWSDEKSITQHAKIMYDSDIGRDSHYGSYFAADEDILTEINQVVALCKLLKDNQFIKTPEDMENILKQLKEQSQEFGKILYNFCIDPYKYGIERESIVYNRQEAEVFIKRMCDSGFEIPKAYQSVLRELCRAGIDNNDNNSESIFKISEEATEQEKAAIQKIKCAFKLNPNNFYHKREEFNLFLSTVIGQTILNSMTRIKNEERALHN